MPSRDWRDFIRGGRSHEGREGRYERGEERFGRGRDEERFRGGPGYGEERFGRGRDEERFGGGGGYGREDDEDRFRRDQGEYGRERTGDWYGGGPYRPPPGPRHVDEGPYLRHPLSHRYRGYEEEPYPFTGPRGATDRRTWFDSGFGGGTPGYTGWGIERYSGEEGQGLGAPPVGWGQEPATGGKAFPDRFSQRRFEDEFPSERTVARRGRGPRNYQRSDERIREEVNERLMRAWMDSSDVDVRVDNGEVTLHGFVDTRQEKRAIEDLAADVLGVKDVHNMLRVDPERKLRAQERGEVPAPERH
jgi:BON domain